MSLKEIIKAKQGAHVVGQMYRTAEICDKKRKQELKRWLIIFGIY